MLVGRGSKGATGRAEEPRRVKHFCSGKQILVESDLSQQMGEVGRARQWGAHMLARRRCPQH
eukprot:5782076-Prymnesium_polylepis.1